MADMRRTESNDTNARNLQIVLDQLVQYEQEYEQITRAQKPQPTPNTPPLA
jgi:hypothetical protein